MAMGKKKERLRRLEDSGEYMGFARLVPTRECRELSIVVQRTLNEIEIQREQRYVISK